ncbi:hypothetical protein [Nocardiopsis halophila]|uniref:hypothetical protein n=1 Tax=Nocardiopsis halophila TaxID=141692 RepID=UPI000348D4BD|nr:hypothetical protein [Nocardiopsis halophila]
MPVSPEHRTRVQLFIDCPDFAPQLLTECLGVQLPEYDQAVLHSADLGEAVAVERRADSVVALLNNVMITELEHHGRTEMVIVVEVQNEFVKGKFRRWAEYAAVAGDRSDCDAAVLAVCPEQRVADQYGKRFRVGPEHWFKPLVIGPSTLPMITDPARVARSPEMAVLAAACHSSAPGVLKALLEGFEGIDPEVAAEYTEYTLTLLDEEARNEVEEIMSTSTLRYHSAYTDRFVRQGLEQGLEQGIAKGKAESLLRVLAALGLAVSEAERERISACTDPDQLDSWLDRAVTATSVAELLEG